VSNVVSQQLTATGGAQAPAEALMHKTWSVRLMYFSLGRDPDSTCPLWCFSALHQVDINVALSLKLEGFTTLPLNIEWPQPSRSIFLD